MEDKKVLKYIEDVLANTPNDWLRLTTHRLDIYDESRAKFQFLDRLEELFNSNNSDASELSELPTAYDYIRLGHPLSSVLEWAVAKMNNVGTGNVISFSSKTTPILAVLRKNLLAGKNTQINYADSLPESFDAAVIRAVYGYKFELNKVDSINEISDFDGSTVFVAEKPNVSDFELNDNLDFVVNTNKELGSIILVNGVQNEDYISEIQHVRRRETIAMTPSNTLIALKVLIGQTGSDNVGDYETNKAVVTKTINEITDTHSKALVGSSGLSMQYAIAMGLIHDAMENHSNRKIKIIVPPNCYGGTNDQARRVAACNDNIEVMDLPVDGDHDMVESIDMVLSKIADEDAVPFIIAEIPTNPRVEVPDLEKLRDALSKERKTASGAPATEPVFILDQTFCPNVHFLGDNDILSTVRTIAYVSGSKFPSGGLCTAGYCVANGKAEDLMDKIELHLQLCDNEATVHQMEFLAMQLPSMIQRIADAYTNTRDFVNYIEKTLPGAKINFVSEELAAQGFTPSVFSLDLPTKGDSHEEREEYKRELNLKLINMMINEIPNESKYCVSYGQLKGCYWTIPATSTQGTTKEGDKDYIVRVALSGNMDLEHHKSVFSKFVDSIG
jgi:cystathionine beta-lyase/cystathionine gamma-synthase